MSDCLRGEVDPVYNSRGISVKEGSSGNEEEYEKGGNELTITHGFLERIIVRLDGVELEDMLEELEKVR